MSIYKESDIELISNNISKIQDQVKKKTFNLFEPYGTDKREVIETIHKYIKDNKRKIYGGYAQHLFVIAKNPKDAFYDAYDFPDIDFYSPEPLNDVYKLCNLLHEKGFKGVKGREAIHSETYSIFVEGEGPYCDISYMPKYIYNKMPHRDINGFVATDPYFMSIDSLRILSDPLTSWEVKLDKRIKRFYLMNKYYPYPHINKQLPITPIKDFILQSVLLKIHEFVTDNQSVMTFGFYSYNHFLMESTILKNKELSKNKFNYIQTPYYEIISTNYKDDALKLIESIKKLVPENDFYQEEYYPFFQFLDNSVYLYYKDKLVAILYNNNKKCIPYKQVDSHYFDNNKFDKGKGKINIISFSAMLMYTLSTIIKVGIDDDTETKNIYEIMLSQLIELREYYFKTNNKNIFDDSLFSDFIIECKGHTVLAKREAYLKGQQNLLDNKPYAFEYYPAKNRKNEAPAYNFANTSGNLINNEKNLKLVGNTTNNTLEVSRIKKLDNAKYGDYEWK